jgi:acyl-CoA synthetase (AMP-forming)/AMP-acid ligase II
MIDQDSIRFITDIPAAQARRRGQKTALSFNGRETSYAELAEKTEAAARRLERLGLGPGARLAWLSKNDDAWFEAFFAAGLLGACLAPINFRLAPLEIAGVLEDSEADLFFVSSEFKAMAELVLQHVGRPPRLVVFDAEEDWGAPAAPGAGADPAPWPPAAPDSDVLQLYTSGTTGRPKGVQLTQANYAFFLEVSPSIEGFDYHEDDTVLIVMPLFHVAGANVSLAGLAHGCRVIILADFSPAAVLTLIGEERVAHMFLAPAMIQMLLRDPLAAKVDVSSLKSIAYGASPISEAVLEEAKARFGCSFIQFYGMTESTGAGTFLAPAAHHGRKLRSCGLPWPGLDVRVCGATGPEGPEAEVHGVGQIAIRGPGIMKGYWARPEATEEAVTSGWLLTGDAGFKDEEGYLYIHDRVKDMIVTGGENVYPAEVENAIFGCPGVADVAVIGVPSERWGEEVKALVVAEAGRAPAPQEVIAWSRARIAGYKAPKSVDFVDVLPRNASGKVLRRELRAPFWDGRGRAVG